MLSYAATGNCEYKTSKAHPWAKKIKNFHKNLLFVAYLRQILIASVANLFIEHFQISGLI
jgi:hypothetical protein